MVRESSGSTISFLGQCDSMEQVPRVESLSHTRTHISEGVVKLSCKGQSGRFAIGQAGLARQDPVFLCMPWDGYSPVASLSISTRQPWEPGARSLASLTELLPWAIGGMAVSEGVPHNRLLTAWPQQHHRGADGMVSSSP